MPLDYYVVIGSWISPHRAYSIPPPLPNLVFNLFMTWAQFGVVFNLGKGFVGKRSGIDFSFWAKTIT